MSSSIAVTVTCGISPVYHSTREPVLHNKMRIMDHASIYLLIVAIFIPFTVITLLGNLCHLAVYFHVFQDLAASVEN